MASQLQLPELFHLHALRLSLETSLINTGVIFNEKHPSWDACLLIISRGTIFILLLLFPPSPSLAACGQSDLRVTHHFSEKCVNFPPILTAQVEKVLSPPTRLTAHLFLSHQNLKRAGNHFWAAHIMATAKYWPCMSVFFKGAVGVCYEGITVTGTVPHRMEAVPDKS